MNEIYPAVIQEQTETDLLLNDLLVNLRVVPGPELSGLLLAVHTT